MEHLRDILVVIFSLIALKNIIGFRWPWEPIVKARLSLARELEAIKSLIPVSAYKSMQESLRKISHY